MNIIYYTDNKLDPEIAELCRKRLLEAADGKRIISVSQKPLDFGDNICVGDIGSSWLNLYKQLRLGVGAADSPYIATAEHDCVYTKEHFNWTPPRDDTFYYNENVYFVQWKGNHPELEGMYSTYWEERRALSQLICNRDLLVSSLDARLKLLDEYGSEVKKVYQGEPGVSKIRLAQEAARSGRPISLAPYLAEYLEKEVSDVFRTKSPNLDIRHKNNFTGPKRGKNRTYDLPPWGRWEEVKKLESL